MTGPAVDGVDYGKLREILNSPAGAGMPPELRARMEADVQKHEQEQVQQATMAQPESTAAPKPTLPKPFAPPEFAPADVSQLDNLFRAAARHERAKQVAVENTTGFVNKMATVAMQPTILAMQFGHDVTMGIAPSPYGTHADPETMDSITRGAQIPIRIVSGITATLVQGAGLMKGLSFAGKVPVVARYLEFIPQRLKEIGMGALINGGIDALRADGFERDAQGQIQASWLDPSAKIGKPLAELGIPDRLALGLGGGVVGALLGPALMGIAAGTNAARTRVVKALSPETIANIQDGLAQAGVMVGAVGDKYRVAQTFIKNFRKVALNEEMSSVMADQLSREQYIANELAANANNASPKITAQVLNAGPGDLAGSGFYIKPDAAVVLPNAASLETNTVEAVKKAMARVGPDEFKRRVEMEVANRSADPLAQAAATEEVARRIIAQPEGTKSAHELLQEVAGTAFADTPAHQAAIKFAMEANEAAALMDTDLPKEAIVDRMLRDKLFTAEGKPYGEVAARPSIPGRAVQPAAKRDPLLGPEPLQPEGLPEIKLNAQKAVDKIETAGQVELDGRLVAGIFRNNPGGINVVTNVKNDLALLAAQERLGVKLTVAKITKPAGPADLTPYHTTWQEMQNLAKGEGTFRIYHGTSIVNAEGIAKEGIKLPSTLDEHIKGIADLYGVNPQSLERLAFGEGGLSRQSYRDANVAKLSTAPAEVARRFADVFKHGEVPTNLNTQARLLAESKRTGKPVYKLYEEGEKIAKEKGLKFSKDATAADVLGLEDKLPHKPGGAIVEFTLDASKAGDWLRQEAQRLVKLAESGKRTPEEIMQTWNTSYNDWKISQEMVKSSRTVVSPIVSGAGTDYLIGRPVYNYPAASTTSVFSKQTAKISEAMKDMAKSAATNITAPKTTEAFILHDGTPIRGGLNTSAMIEKMRMQKPVVNGVGRGDLALQQLGSFIRMEIMDGGKLHITLPSAISKEQFTALGKAIDTMKFNEVTVARGQVEKTFTTPIAAVVQDHVATMIKPQSVSHSISPEIAAQYAKEGVFKGQAVVLPDGSVGEMIGRVKDGFTVREAMTNSEVFVHGDNLSILPSALEGEYKGSNLFASYLDDAERQSLARMRLAMAKRWDRPITKFRDFESFANTRGYIAENVKGGKIRLSKLNEGGAEPVLVKDLKSALAWVRKDTAPLAELGSDEVTKLLGPDRRMGFIGGGGPPPRFNEMAPIDWPRQMKTMEDLPTDRGPSLGQTWLKPTLPLLRDLDKRFGTQLFTAAQNVQSQSVARKNFEALWYHGVGGELPEGVMPLGKIIKMAGKDANTELITDWREADAVGKAMLEKSMTKEELKAAEELGKWYDAAYPALGVGAPFVEQYMPHYREAIQKGTPQSFMDFMASVSGDPLKVPKGTDWVSDHIREGFIDAYNKNAFQVAVQYLRGGAKTRFMKEANDEAREMVRMVASKNPNIALPLANMLQAMGGYEFAEQRAMLKETFQGIMDKLPKSMLREQVGPTLSERFVNWTTSLVYASTMGFRPALALRNAKDIFVMSYPIYHGKRFMEAVGHALTKEGKEEAMAARVISNYGGGMLSADEETAADIARLPQALQDIHAASTLLYDSADEFTRTGTYFAAKFKATEALEDFAKGVKKVGTETAAVDKLKAKLVKDSKIYLFGDEVKDEFLRRAAADPELAARYAGKMGADFTNFLYGRGMQARWMRSLTGRMMGQFGSWSMWYADYLHQLTRMATSGENKLDALGILARHALVNAAILETGREVLNVDLSRWASYGALFYSGGPGVQVAIGASTLMRGLGDASSFGEDPLSQTRISQGSQMIWNTLPAFVPFHSAIRDFTKMTEAYDSTDLLAATLGTRVTKNYQINRKIRILTGGEEPSSPDYEPFQSTSPALGRMLNNMATGKGTQPVDLRTPGAVQTTGLPPAPEIPGRQTGPSATQSMSIKNRPLPAEMPNISTPKTMESKPGESKPIGGY